MEIVWLPIDEVKPYHRNPRNNALAIPEVVKSLREFGWQQPLVVDRSNVIVVGHTRHAAAKSLGMEKVPVKYSNLTDGQAKAYRIKDNRSSERAEWQQEMLLIEMDELLLSEPKYDAAFLDFDVQVSDEAPPPPSAASDADGYFTITLKGPLSQEDDLLHALQMFEAEGVVIKKKKNR